MAGRRPAKLAVTRGRLCRRGCVSVCTYVSVRVCACQMSERMRVAYPLSCKPPSIIMQQMSLLSLLQPLTERLLLLQRDTHTHCTCLHMISQHKQIECQMSPFALRCCYLGFVFCRCCSVLWLQPSLATPP